MASWLVRWAPDRAVLVRALAGEHFLGSDTLLSVPLHSGVKISAGEVNAGGNPAMD